MFNLEYFPLLSQTEKKSDRICYSLYQQSAIFFSVKGQMLNIFSFADHTISVTSTQLS